MLAQVRIGQGFEAFILCERNIYTGLKYLRILEDNL